MLIVLHAWLSLLPLTTVGFWSHDDDSKSHAHMVQRLNGPWLNGCSVSGTPQRLNGWWLNGSLLLDGYRLNG